MKTAEMFFDIYAKFVKYRSVCTALQGKSRHLRQ